ncbi:MULTISPECIES: acyl-CoA carboxylase subunit epsilon [unclassified Corynebacterium]|uniref:acyl-CoA carboxylase subunit epsilon n=1 Tax=unclassified Corynebacterium TaxID=2624378 RepID=UPI002A910A42|nr:acyl-CoA carboxylase subunit epsilon [Corynebacterium sp.]MDY5786240.1 acyl-CoA carboxylase subunit epsilon [Corynebacterium sp.]
MTTPATKETTPIFSVVRGNPNEDEIAALTAVLAELQAAAAAAQAGTPKDRNLWGRPAPLSHPNVFNPGAFANVSYF